MTAVPSSDRDRSGPTRLDRLCGAVDAVNRWAGLLWGFTIIPVTVAVVWEVVMRSFFNSPTLWSNETVIYLSAMTYLMAGGYALLHRAHVRIDILYERFSLRTRSYLDIITFVFFVFYVGTLIWIGTESAWASFLQGETTGSPWNPPIWPVRFAIPLAGLLLLLQGLANLLRDLGVVRGQAP